MVIVARNFLLPFVFTFAQYAEKFHPRTALKVMLVRYTDTRVASSTGGGERWVPALEVGSVGCLHWRWGALGVCTRCVERRDLSASLLP